LAQSLSTATGSEIERVTRLCQRLEFFVSQPPLQVRALSHGESNQSYYIKTAQAEYVLRCYPADSVVCRQQELRCQHAAAAKGLAPAPLCLNNHYQVMLSDYIPHGVAFDYAVHGQPLLLSSLVRFHQLSVQTPVLDAVLYLQQLVAALPCDVTPEPVLLAAITAAARKLQQGPADRVLCHLDLHAGNLLYAADKLWLLDFEYSQLADSSLDLAAICLHFALTAEQEKRLLTGYVALRRHGELQAELTLKLAVAKRVYSGFCWLWYLALPGYQLQAQLWQQRLQQLTT
jgi:thiamine kinase